MAVDIGNIVPYHKLIIPGVGMRAGNGDIQSVLGECSGWLHDLCKSKQINRWAKYKPVPYPSLRTPLQANANKTWKSDAVWWKGLVPQPSITYMDGGHSGIIESISCGLTVRMYFGDISHLIDDWDTYGWQRFWEYTPPTGGANQPFREADFSYYCHKSMLDGGEDNDKPFSSFQCPSVIERGGEDADGDGFIEDGSYYLIYSPAPGVYMRQVENPYLLSLSDIDVRYGAGSVPLSRYYFGLLAVSGSGANRTYNIQTTPFHWDEQFVDGDYHSDMNYRYLEMTDNFLFQMNEGSFYPILSKDPYDGSVKPSGSMSIGSQDAPIVPLPYNPVSFTKTVRPISIRIGVSIVSMTASQVVVDVTATNVTNAQTFNMSWSNIPYNYTCYAKDANGATLYEDPDTMVHQIGTVSNAPLVLDPGDSDTIRMTLSAPSSARYGYFFMLRCGIDYGSYIGAAAVTNDYPS